MTGSENPFVLLARITVKEGMVDEYLAIAEAADKAVEKQKRVCCFITLIVILMTNINLSGLKFIVKVTTFYFMPIIHLFKIT